MNWLYLVIFSNFLFAIVFILDKILVKKFLNPFQYALAVGFLEGFAVILIPFVDFAVPFNSTIIFALLGGISFIVGIYFFFKALEKYEISWVSPLLFGVGVPIVSFIINYFWLGERLGFQHFFAFSFLVVGGVIMSFSGRHSLSSFVSILISSVFLSFYFTFLKTVFSQTNFWSGYIIVHFGAFLFAFLILVFQRRLAKTIIAGVPRFSPLLIFKQALAFIAQLALTYAVYLASPTLINGVGGLRYAFLLIIAIFLSYKWPQLLEEPLKFSIILRKTAAIILLIIGVSILFIQPIKTPGAKIWGVTYSSVYADKELGLEKEALFLAILDDLKIKEFRLVAYWNEIEKDEGIYDFSDLDFQIGALEKREAKAILALGMRAPRWPECHVPAWAQEFLTSNSQFLNNKLLDYIAITINRYKKSSAIWAWQVENEPFLGFFGECPRTDPKFLDKEIALVKSLDKRPIIITDSGELGRWHRAYKRSDIFGTTMYRIIWNKNIPGEGYYKYPLGPDFFKKKAAIVQYLFGKKPIIGVELQAEPWTELRPYRTSLEEQLRVFDLNQFKENIEYAKEVGFERNYLWGVEWWYWMKEKFGHPEYWEEARKLFMSRSVSSNLTIFSILPLKFRCHFRLLNTRS